MKVLSQFAQANYVIREARFTPQELEDLVRRAQSREQGAIDKLCFEYTPMFKRMAGKYAVRTILGYEDALQSCYVYFLELLYSYKDTRFDVLPGLFYLATLRGLYKEIKDTLGYANGTAYLEEENPGTEGLTYEEILEDPRALQELDEVVLRQLVAKLEPMEQIITKGIFFEDKTLDKLGEELGCSYGTVKYYKDKALQHLNYLLLKPKRGRGKTKAVATNV